MLLKLRYSKCKTCNLTPDISSLTAVLDGDTSSITPCLVSGVCIFFFKCSHLNQFIQHHSIKPRQVLDVVSLHHRPILPDMSSELLHVEDQLSYVSAKHTYTHQQV